MFDLITTTMNRPLRERAPASKVVSILAHIVILTLVVGVPLLGVTKTLPEVPSIMAFVAAVPAPPLPPPPPAPPAAKAGGRPVARPAARTPGAFVAPIEAPSDVRPEATTGSANAGAVESSAGGVEGGVEGGVLGGVVGGIVGGIVSSVPPPPPPPPPPAPRGPVRIGGQLTAPALMKRVEPTYPDVAAALHLTGIVILEAVVGTDGCVESVTVLRSRHPLLDKAAVAALKQWRYSPLVLNGLPTPFVLTVTFTFSTR